MGCFNNKKYLVCSVAEPEPVGAGVKVRLRLPAPP